MLVSVIPSYFSSYMFTYFSHICTRSSIFLNKMYTTTNAMGLRLLPDRASSQFKPSKQGTSSTRNWDGSCRNRDAEDPSRHPCTCDSPEEAILHGSCGMPFLCTRHASRAMCQYSLRPLLQKQRQKDTFGKISFVLSWSHAVCLQVSLGLTHDIFLDGIVDPKGLIQ